jgi:hypothetical protein
MVQNLDSPNPNSTFHNWSVDNKAGANIGFRDSRFRDFAGQYSPWFNARLGLNLIPLNYDGFRKKPGSLAIIRFTLNRA